MGTDNGARRIEGHFVCGIAAYAGRRDALPVLLDALERVEYRGYDSCGVAVRTSAGLKVVKAAGAVEGLRHQVPHLVGTTGIGHTRWATVGAPTQRNAHPHTDCLGRIAIVHNGELDDHESLRRRLIDAGHTLRSDTDSELIAHVVEEQYRDNLPQAVMAAMKQLHGMFAIAVIAEGEQGVVVARQESPVVIGLGDGEAFAASDVPALLPHTHRMMHLEDGDVAQLTASGVEVWNDGAPVTRQAQDVRWDPQQMDRAGYDHYLLKEVYEQPKALRHLFAGRLSLTEERVNLDVPVPVAPSEVLLLGCGTSYHAALLGEHLLTEIAGVRARAQVASEFSTATPSLKGRWAVALSQSGETADTIAALRQVKGLGAWTLSVTNVPSSTIARVSDVTFELHAGPEVSVAATKTMLSEVAALALLALSMPARPEPAGLGRGAGGFNSTRRQALLSALHALPGQVQKLLDDTSKVQDIASKTGCEEHLFLVARGPLHPVALEGALKLKEVAYQHAAGVAAGELKHGPFALLGPQTPVIALVAHDHHRLRMLTTIKEVKARGAPVFAVVTEDDDAVAQVVDGVLSVPATDPLLAPLLYTVALQLLAYYTGRVRGAPIDRPRNLAKSVTVY